MEQARKIVRQQDSVSQMEFDAKGHFVMKSVYYEYQLKMTNSTVANKFATFIKSMALYDAMRDTMTYNTMMGDFYAALGSVTSQRDMQEMKQALDDVKSMGGVASSLADTLSKEITPEKIQHASEFENAFKTMVTADRTIMKEAAANKRNQQNVQAPQEQQMVQEQVQQVTQAQQPVTQEVPVQQPMTQEQQVVQQTQAQPMNTDQSAPGAQDPGSSADAGARSATDKAEVATRMAASENKEKVNYQLHIPVGASGKMINHFERLFKVIRRYSKRPVETYQDEFDDEMNKALQSIKTTKDIEDMKAFLQDMASQGELARDLCDDYIDAINMGFQNNQQEQRADKEFVEAYQRAMVAFDNFNRERNANGIDTNKMDNVIFQLQDLNRMLEEKKDTMTKEEYEKYREEITKRLDWLEKMNQKLDSLNNSMNGRMM